MAMRFVGSICLSDIPKKEIKLVECKDGKKRAYLNISIHSKKEAYKDANGKVISDHLISCAPKKEERIEGENYIIGNLKTWDCNPAAITPSITDINNAPTIEDCDESVDLPF